jgi:hypothetical protein
VATTVAILSETETRQVNRSRVGRRDRADTVYQREMGKRDVIIFDGREGSVGKGEIGSSWA